MRIPRLVIIAAALVFAACGSSPPTHYFTLTPVAPAGKSAGMPGYPVQVDAVRIPATLDRDEMVRQSGSNTLSISDKDRWGSPFGEMARNVLAQDLTRRMPQGMVILPDAPAPASAASLMVDVATFREEPDRRVRLEGSWTLLKGESAKPILRREVNLQTQASGDGAGAQASAMSKLLGQLADNIAGELSNSPVVEVTPR